MSTVNATDVTKIKTADDVLPLYQGAGESAKAGIEVEIAFFNPQDPDQEVMSHMQNKLLKNSAAAKLPDIGEWVHNEPTTEVLEVATIAEGYDRAHKVLDDVNLKIKTLTDKAHKLGLKRSYFQELPHKSADDLLSRIVDVDRYKIMYAPYRQDMKKTVEYFAICKSNQVSVSHRNPDHLLQNVRRLYVLAPFLYLLTDNSSGFLEGKPFAGHVGMHMRHHGLIENGRGNVVPYIFSSNNGEEFIAQHIEHVMNNPLFMYYNLDGQLVGVPDGDWGVTFNALKERGLNTASNYYLAQSLIWPDVKVAALKDNEGNVNGHRYEARMFGVGIHQHQTAFIITTALAFHPTFGEDIDILLEKYGFDNTDLADLKDKVNASYEAARQHNGAFFDVRFGTGKMADFAKGFADLIETAAADMDMIEEAEPMIRIMRTGCTDGKVNRYLAPNLKEALDFQKNYDPDVFDNPNRCGRGVFVQNSDKDSPCSETRRSA